MTGPAETRRPYHSPRREAQAAATRREILEAAGRLFARQGYPATTMGAIAGEAGVALKTVYVAFETKGGVLRALWNRTLRGDDEVPVAEQPWYREALDEPDPERQLRLNARNSRLGKERLGVVGQVIRAAAPSDPEIAALWDRIQTDYRENQRAIVASIEAKGALREGLVVDRAADILWALNNPDVWHLLVGLRGWTADAYERWSGDTAVAQLLG
ncbi:MAG TPA: helix-turn-helix domain-containing protein [Gaiellaceae bacterium]